MSAKPRITRPEPERTQPIRDWQTLFGATANGGPAASTSAMDRLNDAVSRSVDLGYRVIDEYVRQGQRAAQRLSDRSYNPQSITSDVQELTMRIGQYASEFAAVWFELMQAAVTGIAERQAPPNGNETTVPSASPSSAPATADAGHAHVRIAISSVRPAEVSVELRSDAAGRALIVHALRAVDPDIPRIADIAFEPAINGEPPTLRLRIPPEQPAATYHALLVDPDSNRPAGTVNLRIAPD